MIAVAQFIGLPLLFFSSLLIARALIPGWMQTLSLLNPVEWAVRAARGRGAARHRLGRDGRSTCCCSRASRALTTPFATWSFRSYQRTLTDDRRPRRSRSGLSDASRDRRCAGTVPGRGAMRIGSRPTARQARDRSTTRDGVWLLPGTPYRDAEAAFAAIRHCLATGTPFLGTCGGFQHALVELARSRAGIAEAAHEESDPMPSTSRQPARLQPGRRGAARDPDPRNALRGDLRRPSRSRATTTAASGSIPRTSSRSSGQASSSARPLRMQESRRSSCRSIPSSSRRRSSPGRCRRARRLGPLLEAFVAAAAARLAVAALTSTPCRRIPMTQPTRPSAPAPRRSSRRSPARDAARRER